MPRFSKAGRGHMQDLLDAVAVPRQRRERMPRVATGQGDCAAALNIV